MITKPPYNSLLDERCLAVWESPSGKRHVEGWFSQTLCGKYIYNWTWIELTSVRWLGKIAQGVGYRHTDYCKRCVSSYKDVNVNA